MLELLAGALSAFLSEYFEKHSFSIKKTFLVNFLAFTMLCWIYLLLMGGTDLVSNILAAIKIGALAATTLTALHLFLRLLSKWAKQEAKDNK
jgi:hypothetical protein